jgi:hypothetical protein
VVPALLPAPPRDDGAQRAKVDGSRGLAHGGRARREHVGAAVEPREVQRRQQRARLHGRQPVREDERDSRRDLGGGHIGGDVGGPEPLEERGD